MLVFGHSAVVMALPCCPSREPHAPTWGAPGLSRGRFLSLEGRGVVPGGFRSGVRWIQETGQVVNDRLAWISQIELNSLNMRPSGMERTINLDLPRFWAGTVGL